MRRIRPLIILMATLLLSSALAGTAAGQTPRADDHAIRIVGSAQPSDTFGTGVYAGTTVSLRLLVRCPKGSGPQYIPFAGMPDAFGGRFAEPYLPAMTSPTTYGGVAQCTGRWERASTVARSISRLQDPATQPFDTFERGRTRFVVQLGLSEPLATHTRSVQVVVPGAPRR